MGRIKTTFIKRIAQDLFAEHGDKLTTDFEKNKEIIKELIEFDSKRMRNVVVGYITRMKRRAS